MSAKKLAEQIAEAGTGTTSAATGLSAKIKSTKIKIDIAPARLRPA
jgi:hypothetical protein